MKLSASLTVILISVAASSWQSASAQESRAGARFNYAPNIWKAESARVPKGYGEYAEPAHNVRSGAVPSSNMLGVDPSMLEKPAPPPQVAATPAMTSVTPSMSIPKTNATFNPAFGKPQGVVAQSVPPAMPASVPVVKPQTAKPAQAKPVVASAAPAPRHHSVSHTAVSARLMPPALNNVVPAHATPAVASYDKNFGYVPGAYLPSNTGGGEARASVKARLMTNPNPHHHQ